MRWSQTLQLVDVHAEGEIGRVITGGQPSIPGATIVEKLDYLNSGNDELRRMLVLEPRGAAAGSTNLLFPPENPENHAGFIVLQPDQAHASSGSNSICVTTALLETGIVKMQDGENIVRLETAAGVVVAHAQCEGGKCLSVSLSMPASYVEVLDHEIHGTKWGTLKADIAYGGVFYAILDADKLGLKIEPAQAHDLAAAGMELKDILNQTLQVAHPEIPEINGVAYVMFRDFDEDGALKTATTMWPGRLDRSPCGTGNSANLAILAARGEIAEGDEYISRSTIGSEFKVRHTGTTTIANKPAVLPTITGRGWIYGIHQLGVDPTDPFAKGFALTDTWGPEAGKI